jgi:hypothetical protein
VCITVFQIVSFFFATFVLPYFLFPVVFQDSEKKACKLRFGPL